MRKSFAKSVAAAAFLAGALMANATFAAPLTPQVDFRSNVFSAADNQTSFHIVEAGIGFTLEAFHADINGNLTAANLWWDSMDGVGVRGGWNDDEIDINDVLRITFDNTIGLSEIYISDLFAQQHHNGLVYDEQGQYQIDNGVTVSFDAGTLGSTAGDKLNGENLITLSKVVPVNSLTFTSPNVPLAISSYSILGFTDPPLPGTNEVPVPGSIGLTVLLGGLAAVGLARRRQMARI